MHANIGIIIGKNKRFCRYSSAPWRDECSRAAVNSAMARVKGEGGMRRFQRG